ncbi:hypothetical protein [Magnetofaba australis]|uniref:Uncharacterized protein n=1 Tax=Magnetofaba australis IT-1 TaxID=1434232 RepID=A0A1Y2K9P6_9PROT|nr:hypothetical protein [Magnetofaba australis]OSM07674.1 hypothetical protein MAIT1_04561 [Magnetofaba australis IT-1]
MSDEIIKAWRERDDPLDDIIRHFTDDFARWDWCDVADEGRRICNLMFDLDIEKHSPFDGIFAGVAAQANHGAINAMAAALGVDGRVLYLALAHWSEEQDNPPQPVTFDALMEMGRKSIEGLNDSIDASIMVGEKNRPGPPRP